MILFFCRMLKVFFLVSNVLVCGYLSLVHQRGVVDAALWIGQKGDNNNKRPNVSTARLNFDQRPIFGSDFIDVINYSMQKYFRKTKEDHSQKSASGHN